MLLGASYYGGGDGGAMRRPMLDGDMGMWGKDEGPELGHGGIWASMRVLWNVVGGERRG